MGLHLPGAAFVNPNTPLRDALTRAATQRVAEITALGNAYTPIGRVLDERAFVNGIVGLMATGGSTNHTLHLVAMAARRRHPAQLGRLRRASRGVTPLLARIYPNGLADVNQFEAAGGMPFVIGQLLDAGPGPCRRADRRRRGRARALPAAAAARRRRAGLGARPRRRAGDTSIVRPAGEPFSPEGGLKLLQRQSRPRRDQDLGGQAGASADRGAGRDLRPTRTSCWPPSRRASSTATSSPWSASRARRPTACPSCTS